MKLNTFCFFVVLGSMTLSSSAYAKGKPWLNNTDTSTESTADSGGDTTKKKGWNKKISESVIEEPEQEPLPVADSIIEDPVREPEPLPLADSAIEEPVPKPEPAIDAPVQTNALISWIIPNLREDGSALQTSELSHYEIHYSIESSGEIRSINIESGDATGYTFSSLSPDTYNIAIIAVDVNGLSSQMSAVTTFTIE